MRSTSQAQRNTGGVLLAKPDLVSAAAKTEQKALNALAHPILPPPVGVTTVAA